MTLWDVQHVERPLTRPSVNGARSEDESRLPAQTGCAVKEGVVSGRKEERYLGVFLKL